MSSPALRLRWQTLPQLLTPTHLPHHRCYATIARTITTTATQHATDRQQPHRPFASKAPKAGTGKPDSAPATTRTSTGSGGAAAGTTSSAADKRVDMSFLDIFKTQRSIADTNDTAYPDWVFELNQPLPSKFQLDRTIFQELPEELMKRTIKLNRRTLIRDDNYSRAKKNK